MLLAVCHSSKTGWSKVDDLDLLSDLRAETGNLLWAEADVADITTEDIQVIAEEFDLHPLAVEDAMNTRQRPKVDDFGTHIFIVLHQLNEEHGHLEAVQIACFVGERFVLTLHDGATRTIEEAKERWSKAQPAPQHPSLLLYTLFDVVVDDYQRIADELESDVEELEEIALATPLAPTQRQLYNVKQRVARMRRYVLPEARILDWATSPETVKSFSQDTAELFGDISDHLERIAGQVRNADELAQAVIDLTRAEQANNLNENSRKLSAWAAIFAVGTLVAGIYGMNFSLIPPTNSRSGFWFSLTLMATLSGALYWYFKKKEWL